MSKIKRISSIIDDWGGDDGDKHGIEINDGNAVGYVLEQVMRSEHENPFTISIGIIAVNYDQNDAVVSGDYGCRHTDSVCLNQLFLLLSGSFSW